MAVARTLFWFSSAIAVGGWAVGLDPTIVNDNVYISLYTSLMIVCPSLSLLEEIKREKSSPSFAKEKTIPPFSIVGEGDGSIPLSVTWEILWKIWWHNSVKNSFKTFYMVGW